MISHSGIDFLLLSSTFLNKRFSPIWRFSRITVEKDCAFIVSSIFASFNTFTYFK